MAAGLGAGGGVGDGRVDVVMKGADMEGWGRGEGRGEWWYGDGGGGGEVWSARGMCLDVVCGGGGSWGCGVQSWTDGWDGWMFVG